MKKPIVCFSKFDLDTILFDREVIEQYNPQRHEMSQLDAIVYEDAEETIIVGYKDVTDNEFWIRGHMPSFPIMPGVIICEAAAQLSSYAAHKYELLGPGYMVGLGGLNDIRIRNIVQPGQRLVVMLKKDRARKGRLVDCDFQAWVGETMVADGGIIGIPLPKDES